MVKNLLKGDLSQCDFRAWESRGLRTYTPHYLLLLHIHVYKFGKYKLWCFKPLRLCTHFVATNRRIYNHGRQIIYYILYITVRVSSVCTFSACTCIPGWCTHQHVN